MKAATEAPFVRRWLAAQPFWVAVSVVLICAVMSWLVIVSGASAVSALRLSASTCVQYSSAT